MTRHPVALVGAGPGDPELLTLKAVRVLRSATVVLVDDLVGEAIVQLAGERARIVRVGKRGGCRSTPQAFIERLMIRLARNGERVVRLKGGDPFIFGRGGEEVETLRAAGIEVEIVNGITAGLAAVSTLGLPLTHREHASGVLLVTGHARDREAGPDWVAMGHSAQALRLTLVIYMGIAGLARIADGLRQGLGDDKPALVVQHATTPLQRQCAAPLHRIAAAVREAGLGSPGVVIVGDVIAGLRSAQAAAPLQADGDAPAAPAASPRSSRAVMSSSSAC